MCAIGRALMADPTVVLLDEPSMGLAPQIVEEVFAIVRDLNQRERVTFLLAGQNTSMALRFADYGYILENGHVVMDGRLRVCAITKMSRSSTSASAVLSARAFAMSKATSGASAGLPEGKPCAITTTTWRGDAACLRRPGHLLEKAADLQVELPSSTKVLVSGEAFPPSCRDWLAARGVDGEQCYATADLGLIAYETASREGLVIDEGILLV